MKKINKKVKKTIILAKKVVKKVVAKMPIKSKTKVKPKLIVKPKIKSKSKSQPKIVSKSKSAASSKTKLKSAVSSKTKAKVKIVVKVKTPVKISVRNKNKAKKAIIKKPIIKKPVTLIKTKKVVIKKPATPVRAKKAVSVLSSRGVSPRNPKKSRLNITPGKTAKTGSYRLRHGTTAPGKQLPKKVIKVIKKPANKVVVDKSKTNKVIKVIKKVDKVNMIQMSKPKKSDNLSPVVGKPYSFHTEEEYMNEEQIAHFKKILLEWKENLMESVDSTMHHMQDEAANYPDPVDRASQEEGFSLELRTRDRERKLLKKIDETLLRINEQDYGYCDDCGAEIGIRRLEARPTANQCIECKTIAEIREKQIGEIN